MDKLFVVIMSLFLFFSCNTYDVAPIKRGYSSHTVIEKIGEPKLKRNMDTGVDWWYYGKRQVVVFENDTVTRVIHNIKSELDSLNSVQKRKSAIIGDK
ncbi:MAG: hypothetical protein H0W62_13270 [Chitinophagales bacterium]|nr:hypothetical protein [Chitinophagales bacterium]